AAALESDALSHCLADSAVGRKRRRQSTAYKAVAEKNGNFSLNNSHVIVFDIHSEYKSAFPSANHIDISNLVLPYWMLNSEELEEFFLDTEANDHNQRNIFKEAIIKDRRAKFGGSEAEKQKIHLDTPILFDIKEVLAYAIAKNEEMVDTGEVYAASNKEKAGQPKYTQGSLYGKLTNFVNRLENKVSDSRLDFFLGEKSKSITFEGACQ
ncbi:helicase HerA domain-containing protein, partial [Ralstonia pseudosolanacearum]|uniref:helicase HerA domain-containing protein n=1 Tax=Ralstonia pseudosolanacearum TaxID=1310165 RepID=UPI001FF8BE29